MAVIEYREFPEFSVEFEERSWEFQEDGLSIMDGESIAEFITRLADRHAWSEQFSF